jgi:two-component system, cell cycle response regulator DivK
MISRPNKMPKVLLAEDSELIWQFLQERLEHKGYSVILAHDGEAAVANARAAHPDLILMDMGLPVLGGFAATRAIKGDSHTAAIPVIAISGSAGTEEQEKARAAGCDAFHAKPIDLNLLMRQIAAALTPGEEDPPTEADDKDTRASQTTAPV